MKLCEFQRNICVQRVYILVFLIKRDNLEYVYNFYPKHKNNHLNEMVLLCILNMNMIIKMDTKMFHSPKSLCVLPMNTA